MVDPRLFQALSDGTRLEILSLLAGGTVNVSRIVAHVGSAQPAVSRHLRVLREASLISDRRKGKQVEYSIRPAALKAAAAYLADIAGVVVAGVDIAEPGESREIARRMTPEAGTAARRQPRKVKPATPQPSRPTQRPTRRQAREIARGLRRAPARTPTPAPVRRAAREPARDFVPDEAEFRVEPKPRPKSGLDDFLL